MHSESIKTENVSLHARGWGLGTRLGYRIAPGNRKVQLIFLQVGLGDWIMLTKRVCSVSLDARVLLIVIFYVYAYLLYHFNSLPACPLPTEQSKCLKLYPHVSTSIHASIIHPSINPTIHASTQVSAPTEYLVQYWELSLEGQCTSIVTVYLAETTLLLHSWRSPQWPVRGREQF